MAAIAQASVAGSQGGPSNLKRFRAHHPRDLEASMVELGKDL